MHDDDKSSASADTVADYMSLPLISDIPGMSPHMGRLFSMMTHARATTLDAVDGLSRVEVDHVHDPDSNSIGALLLHIAAVEKLFQCRTFWDRELNDDERVDWQPALDLGDTGRREIKGQDLPFYVGKLEAARSITQAEFQQRDDDWLHTITTQSDGRTRNRYFAWFHMFEDELNHRGQIRWLRKRVPSRHG